MIAFCITCRGRAQHIKLTLPRNLADNKKAKFILLDYGSPDDLLEYVKTNHADEIQSGRLAVYSYEADRFRMAHAKNMAHRLGMREGASILVNLDADNFAGKDFDLYVTALFHRAKCDREKIFLWARMIQGQMKRGISGRIAMTAKTFMLTNGYDEYYADWGCDDKDMTARLTRLGLKAIEIDAQYLDAIHHKDKLRFKEYPHAKPAPGVDSGAFYLENDNTIANFGNFGCGLVEKRWGKLFDIEWRERIELLPIPTRIFGIGMQKTATTSLDAALKVLGFDSAHWESGKWAMSILREMRTGRSLTVEKSYALCDLPIPILFRELDKAYPGSKFILTIRDEVDWLRSARDHWSYEHNRFRTDWDIYPAANVIHRATYGQKNFDAEIFLARYRQHNAEVREYFKNRPADLLVMDMSRGAGWNELCQFLQKLIPDVPYPRHYETV
jgi:Sulfotransferase domain/N-terminal domain of galactosyltransferase